MGLVRILVAPNHLNVSVYEYGIYLIVLQTEHEDYDALKEAVEGMRGVAFLINERKRRMESLEKVVLWQRRVDAWKVNKYFALFHR